MGLVFRCPHCGLSNAIFPAHHAVCTAIQSLKVVTYSEAVAEFDRLRKLLAEERAENEQLRAERAKTTDLFVEAMKQNERLQAELSKWNIHGWWDKGGQDDAQAT